MRILTLVIVLVLTYFGNVYAQSNCLTDEEVRKSNYLLDDRDWLKEQARLDSIQLVEYQQALTASIALEQQARNEAANMDTLRLIAVKRYTELESIVNKEQKKVKRRDRLLWIVSTVAFVETVVIGVSYGLSSR
jgi:hypothetical protein